MVKRASVSLETLTGMRPPMCIQHNDYLFSFACSSSIIFVPNDPKDVRC
jgi:hypothetical protein